LSVTTGVITNFTLLLSVLKGDSNAVMKDSTPHRNTAQEALHNHARIPVI